MQKTANSSETNYFYSGLELLYTKDGNGDIIEENVLEDDGSIINSHRADTYDYWYRQDIRGSVTNIVDVDDDVVKSYTYDAYGNTDSTSEFVNSFAYTGAVIDEETGLYYMNARYYEPETGRFISEDSYRGDGEAFWHLYVYCDGDPVNFIDPSGHGSYSRTKAIQYANKWWNSFNPKYPYHKHSDCANFVSQCLHAGGIPFDKKWSPWGVYHYYGPNVATSYASTKAWQLAREQYKYFMNSKYSNKTIHFKAKNIKLVILSGVKKGDIMYFDSNGDGIPNHATIVSNVSNSMIYYSAHTEPRQVQPVSYFFKYASSKAKAIILKMKNTF